MAAEIKKEDLAELHRLSMEQAAAMTEVSSAIIELDKATKKTGKTIQTAIERSTSLSTLLLTLLKNKPST